MNDLRALAARVLNGEVPAGAELRHARSEAIADASGGLRLTKAAVAGVLRATATAGGQKRGMRVGDSGP